MVNSKRCDTLCERNEGHGILLRDLNGNGPNEISLEGYCDADFATDKAMRRSKTGYLFMVNGSMIDWRIQLQSTVAVSTAEAEYMSLAKCTKKALWLRTIQAKLLGKAPQAVPIHCDIQQALQMAKELNCVSKTKRIDVKHHFVRERGLTGEMVYVYCPSEDILPDCSTKVLRLGKFKKLMNQLGVQEM